MEQTGKKIFFILSAVVFCSVKAQTFSVGTPTPVFDDKNPQITSFLTGSVKNFFVSTWETSSHPTNHIYSWLSDATPYDEDVETPGEKSENSTFRDILGTTEGMYLFRSAFKKSEKKNCLYAHFISAHIEVKSPGIEIASMPAEKSNKSGEFGINCSPSGNFVVAFGQFHNEKGTKEKFNITVADAKMNVKWTKEFEFPYPSQKEPFNDVFISNEGTVMIIKRPDEINFSAFIIQNALSPLTETKLEMPPSKKIMNYNIGFNSAGDILVAGYFSGDENVFLKTVNFEGNYFFRIGKSNGKIAAKKTNAFSSPLKNIEIRNIVAVEGNKTLIVGEVFKKERLGMSGGYEGADKVSYSIGNIYVSMLDENGKTIWDNVIEKESSSDSDGAIFGQAGFQTCGDKFLFIFNDENRKYSMNNGKIPVIVTISKDGTKDKPFPIVNSKVGGPSDIKLITSASIKTSDKEILFLGKTEESVVPLTLKLK